MEDIVTRKRGQILIGHDGRFGPVERGNPMFGFQPTNPTEIRHHRHQGVRTVGEMQSINVVSEMESRDAYMPGYLKDAVEIDLL